MTEANSPPSSPSLVDSSGEALTVDQAIANLKHPDLSLRYYAAWWLGKFSEGDPQVVDALIAALEDEDDQTELGGYPLRRNAARALGKLGDRRAVLPLVRCLDCTDFYVQEAAAQSLGMLGDPVCVPDLMRFLEGGVAAALQVPGRPHLARPVEGVIEALEALDAREAVPLVRPFLEHPVERVACMAARAMYALTQEAPYGDRLVQALGCDDVKLRRIILMDLGSSGYLAGAEAIASASVESSFKIIALKSLLDNHFKRSQSVVLSEAACRVMALMDALL